MQREQSAEDLAPRVLEWQWVVLLFAFTFTCAFFHVSGADIGFHIRTGELVLQQGAIPAQNTFSFARPDDPWGLHQWAPGVVLYLVYRHGGIVGLIVFKALLAAAIFLVVWLAARAGERARAPAAFWAATIGVLLARSRFFERPFLFSGLLMALLMWWCLRHGRRYRWTLVGVPVFMAIWANLHLGVIYGFVYLGALAIADGLRRLPGVLRPIRSAQRECPGEGAPRSELLSVLHWPAVAVLSIVAAGAALWLINPHGPAVLRYPVDYFLDPFWKNLIVEFHPPAGPQAMLLGGSIALLAVLLIVTRRCPMDRLVPTLVFAWFAARTQRIALMHAIVAAPCLAYLLHAVVRQRLRVSWRWTMIALPPAWVLLALVAMRDPTLRFGVGINPVLHPRAMFRFLERDVPQQNMYNDMMYGGSVLWWLYPKFRPFIDGRCEAYSYTFWRDEYVPVSTGARPWKPVFGAYGISAALVYNPRDKPLRPLVSQLHDHPDWALVAFDDTTLLFLERNTTNAAVIEAHEFHVIWPGDWSLGFESNNANAALVEAMRAQAINPRGIFAQTALARAQMVAGKFEDAVQNYRKLTSSPRAGAGYWRDLAYCLFMAGDLDSADKASDWLIEHHEQAAYAYFLKHLVAARRGNHRAADTFLRRAVQRDPGNAEYAEAQRRFDAQAATDDDH